MFGKKKSKEGIDTTAQTNTSGLSNLSPTSYARQFDALDNVVAAATQQSGGGEVDDEELAKNMNALSLKMSRGKQQQQGGSNNILDFDADSDGVFEDDSGDDDEDDDIKSDTAGGGGVIIDNSSSLFSRFQKGKFGKKKNSSVDDHRGRQTSSDRGSRYSSSESRSIAMTDEGGRGRGGATSASSSSSSMGDDASVGTTESEDDIDGMGGKNKKSGHGSDSAEDYTDDEDEGEDGYKPGGYHPVKVGEVYNQR